MSGGSERGARRVGPAVESIYRFVLWLVPAVEKFPRRQKFLLGDGLQATALDLLERLVEATYTRDRRLGSVPAVPSLTLAFDDGASVLVDVSPDLCAQGSPRRRRCGCCDDGGRTSGGRAWRLKMGTDSTLSRRAVRVNALVLAVGLFAVPTAGQAAGRVALVVGNSAYAAIGTLPNPGNDAADMAAALRRLGFEVTTALDADRVELNDVLRAFTRQSAGADVSLVFYAGHGIEMDGVNYLVPVDARLERDTDVRFEAVELDYVLAATVGAGLRVVILDACRNNPLARSMQRTGRAGA